MQAKGAGESIRYGTASTELGPTLVARTASGLCAVAFGDREEELFAELQERYPAATLTAAGQGLAVELGDLQQRLAEPGKVRPLPTLDLAGTPFEQRVWTAMATIPSGQTREYGQFAASLGMRQAQRAVGAAIGKNPIALLLPCHRLVAKGGGLHRYRWGVERKRWLLAKEGALPSVADPAQRGFAFGDLE